MSYEQYWYADTRLLKAFYEAYKLKQEQINHQAWLNGVYVYKAISSIASALTSKNKSDIEPYPTQPVEIYPKQKSEQQLQEEKEQELMLAKAWLSSLVQVGKSWDKKKQP